MRCDPVGLLATAGRASSAAVGTCHTERDEARYARPETTKSVTGEASQSEDALAPQAQRIRGMRPCPNDTLSRETVRHGRCCREVFNCGRQPEARREV